MCEVFAVQRFQILSVNIVQILIVNKYETGRLVGSILHPRHAAAPPKFVATRFWSALPQHTRNRVSAPPASLRLHHPQQLCWRRVLEHVDAPRLAETRFRRNFPDEPNIGRNPVRVEQGSVPCGQSPLLPRRIDVRSKPGFWPGSS